MRLASTTLTVVAALLLSAYGLNASAENKTDQRQKPKVVLVNPNSLYIEVINENEVEFDDQVLTFDELKDYIKSNPRDLPEQQTILYITDTQFVNQAYDLSFELEPLNKKHVWVTYKPFSLN